MKARQKTLKLLLSGLKATSPSTQLPSRPFGSIAESLPQIQAKPVPGPANVSSLLPAVARALPIQRQVEAVDPLQKLSSSAGGTLLPEPVRQKFEESFQTSFADIRIHQGPEAQSIGAIAYTRGSNLHFAPGHYAPNSPTGQQLLGHELTHVMQQRQGQVTTPQGKGLPINADLNLEAEADRLGAQAAQGETVQVSGASAGIQRKRNSQAAVIQCAGGSETMTRSRRRSSVKEDEENTVEELAQRLVALKAGTDYQTPSELTDLELQQRFAELVEGTDYQRPADLVELEKKAERLAEHQDQQHLLSSIPVDQLNQLARSGNRAQARRRAGATVKTLVQQGSVPHNPNNVLETTQPSNSKLSQLKEIASSTVEYVETTSSTTGDLLSNAVDISGIDNIARFAKAGEIDALEQLDGLEVTGQVGAGFGLLANLASGVSSGAKFIEGAKLKYDASKDGNLLKGTLGGDKMRRGAEGVISNTVGGAGKVTSFIPGADIVGDSLSIAEGGVNLGIHGRDLVEHSVRSIRSGQVQKEAKQANSTLQYAAKNIKSVQGDNAVRDAADIVGDAMQISSSAVSIGGNFDPSGITKATGYGLKAHNAVYNTAKSGITTTVDSVRAHQTHKNRKKAESGDRGAMDYLLNNDAMMASTSVFRHAQGESDAQNQNLAVKLARRGLGLNKNTANFLKTDKAKLSDFDEVYTSRTNRDLDPETFTQKALKYVPGFLKTGAKKLDKKLLEPYRQRKAQEKADAEEAARKKREQQLSHIKISGPMDVTRVDNPYATEYQTIGSAVERQNQLKAQGASQQEIDAAWDEEQQKATSSGTLKANFYDIRPDYSIAKYREYHQNMDYRAEKMRQELGNTEFLAKASPELQKRAKRLDIKRMQEQEQASLASTTLGSNNLAVSSIEDETLEARFKALKGNGLQSVDAELESLKLQQWLAELNAEDSDNATAVDPDDAELEQRFQALKDAELEMRFNVLKGSGLQPVDAELENLKLQQLQADLNAVSNNEDQEDDPEIAALEQRLDALKDADLEERLAALKKR